MKILVVEDEVRIADNLKKGLELEKYSVDVAYDGAKGYDLASSGDYNLIILDLMLPQMDGLTICKKLRDNNLSVPILMLTAKSEIRDKVIGLDSGADDYLPKPFSFEELVSRVRALLRRPLGIQNDVLKLGDLELNKSTFAVSRSGVGINLSHHEFNLLSFLLSRPNVILSKEKIIDSVWHFDADILPNTVEATVKNLRKKIEKPFPKLPKIIHTFRGLGYQIKSHV